MDVEYSILDDLPAGIAPGQKNAPDEWGEPLPLCARIDEKPYPVDALPDLVGAAVREVQAYVQSPLPLVAQSAMSALSVAIQPHINVERADSLSGPVSLYSLAIAKSGERKTSGDRYFTKEIESWVRAAAEELRPEIDEYQADMLIHSAKEAGIKQKIQHLSKEGKPTAEQEQALHDLQAGMPEEPAVPDLLLGDETPEHLAWRLVKKWPTSGVLSNEAGVVFGAHGMKSDSVMQNLGLLNVLWDGGSLSIGRKTTDSFRVEDVRLTMGLQVQAETIREFFSRSGQLARGSGFMARFLVAWPRSTQGTRFYRDPPTGWPGLSAFNYRLRVILDTPIPYDPQARALQPETIRLGPDAHAAWVEFHDDVERELGDGGELADVSDTAAKVADNAARLAALFQYFEHGAGDVTADMFARGAAVAAWHLSEARRFFGELATPPETQAAAHLQDWLTHRCKETGAAAVPRSDALQLGPARLRSSTALGAALDTLADAHRARPAKHGRKVMIEVNPALVGGGRGPTRPDH